MRCWAEINIKNLYENIKEIEKIAFKEHIMAVIKADAYGHGMNKICEMLIKKGIRNFAMATAEERSTGRSSTTTTEGSTAPVRAQ